MSRPKMTSDQAFPADTQGGGFYADLDEETGLYCSFGAETGFAYGSFSSQLEAQRHTEELQA